MANDYARLIPREIREQLEEVTSCYPQARFLSKEEQARYEEACRSFSNPRAITSLNVPRNGSNLFKVLLLNQIGIRTASLGELESALENGLGLRGYYEDVASAVLRSPKDDDYSTNTFLSQSLS